MVSTRIVSDVEVLAWFQGLEPAKRLDFAVQLLQMLGPFELRFVGACLEDLARKNSSHSALRDLEYRANEQLDVMAQLCGDISDSTSRQLLLLILPLVHSNNTAAATAIFGILEKFSYFLSQDSVLAYSHQVANEIVMLLTMGRSHPAFKFEQRKVLADMFNLFHSWQHQAAEPDNAAQSTSGLGPKNKDSRDSSPSTCSTNQDVDNVSAEATPYGCSPNDSETKNANQKVPSAGLSCECSEEEVDQDITNQLEDGFNGEPGATAEEYEENGFCRRCHMRHGEEVSRPSSSATSVSDISPPVYITGIKVKRCEESQQPKVGWRQIRLLATWSSGETTEVVKTPAELYDYHRRLLDLFPKAAGCYGHKRSIPYFPGCQHLEKDGKNVNFPLVIKYVDGPLKRKAPILDENPDSEGNVRVFVQYGALLFRDLKYLSPKILGCSYSFEFFGMPIPVLHSTSSDTDLCLSRLFDTDLPVPQQNNAQSVEPELPAQAENADQELKGNAKNDISEGPPMPSLNVQNENGPTLVSQSSADTDEDRDLCVKNGTVHECTFHNSSQPTPSEVNSLRETPGTDATRSEINSVAGMEDRMSDSCVSLPARLEGNEGNLGAENRKRMQNGPLNTRSLYGLNNKRYGQGFGRYNWKGDHYSDYTIRQFHRGGVGSEMYGGSHNKRYFYNRHGQENWIPEPLFSCLRYNRDKSNEDIGGRNGYYVNYYNNSSRADQQSWWRSSSAGDRDRNSRIVSHSKEDVLVTSGAVENRDYTLRDHP